MLGSVIWGTSWNWSSLTKQVETATSNKNLHAEETITLSDEPTSSEADATVSSYGMLTEDKAHQEESNSQSTAGVLSMISGGALKPLISFYWICVSAWIHQLTEVYDMLEISNTTRDSCETCDPCEGNPSWNQPDTKISPWL